MADKKTPTVAGLQEQLEKAKDLIRTLKVAHDLRDIDKTSFSWEEEEILRKGGIDPAALLKASCDLKNLDQELEFSKEREAGTALEQATEFMAGLTGLGLPEAPKELYAGFKGVLRWMGRSAAQSSEDERLYDHRARRDKRNKKLLERRLELLREQRFMVVPGSDEDKQLCATILELLRSEPDDQ